MTEPGWGNFGAATPTVAAPTVSAPPPHNVAPGWGNFGATPAAKKTAPGWGSFGTNNAQKPEASTFLGKLIDMSDVPLAGAEAALHDIPEMLSSGKPVDYWMKHDPFHTEQVYKDLHSGGEHKVAENDVYFRQGSLKRVLADPNASHGQKAIAQWLMHNPKWAAAGDFASELANPSNVMLGPIVDAAAKGAGTFLHALPLVGTAIDHAGAFGQELFNKYAPLKKISERAAQIGRHFDTITNAKRFHNQQLMERIFGKPGKFGIGGTAAEERWEILRRSAEDTPMNPADLRKQFPNTPGFGKADEPFTPTLTDAELNDRAALLRASYDVLDQEKIARGIMRSSQAMPHYFRMDPKTDYNQPVFDRMPPLSRGSGGGSRVALRYHSTETGSKVFKSPTDVLEANEYYMEHGGKPMLTNTVDPSLNFMRHANEVSSTVALDEFIKTLVKEEPLAARELLQPYKDVHIPAGTVTHGDVTREMPEGYAVLTHVQSRARASAMRNAVGRAAQEIANEFDIPVQDMFDMIKSRFPLSEKLLTQLKEVKHTGKVLNEFGGTAEQAARTTEQTLQKRAEDRAGLVQRLQAKPAPNVRQMSKAAGQQSEAERAAGVASTTAPVINRALTGARRQTLRRGMDIIKKIQMPERDIMAKYRKLRDAYYSEYRKAAYSKAFNQASDVVHPGMDFIKNVPGLSGLERLDYTVVAPEVEKYLTQMGATRPEATGIGKFFDGFNAIYRIGIVTNPLVHPFKNLFWAYLGAGGNPARLATVFRGGETALDKEAGAWGAHAHFGTMTPFGGNEAQMNIGRFADQRGLGKAQWAMARMVNANRKLVFDRFERNMATSLWDDLSKRNLAQGMDEATAKRSAAESVRKAFGDYNNITPFETHIQRAFYFYPWLKTVVPFWIHTGLHRPWAMTAPLTAMHAYNELAGDPNAGTEKPGTLFTGMHGQAPQYISAGMPQTKIDPLTNVFAPRVEGQPDPNAGIPERTAPVIQMALSHMVPGLHELSQTLVQQLNKQPQEPGVTPSEVMYNRAAPFPEQAKEWGGYVARTALPFGGMVSNLYNAAKQGPQSIPSALLGGYVYNDLPPSVQHILSKKLNTFVRKYDHAFVVGHNNPQRRDQLQADAYAQFEKEKNNILQNLARIQKQNTVQSPQPNP